MFCVLIKELRQFRRSTTSIVMIILSLLFAFAALAQYKFKGELLLSQFLNGAAYLIAGLNQLAVITAAGIRWKNENGDGSLDIISTTPVTPLQVSCAKLAATSIVAFAAFPLPVIFSGIMTPDASFFKMLILAFMQILALSSVSLGCSTFQNKKSGSFDWIMLITVISLLPVVSLVYKSFSGDIINDHFYAALTGLGAITISGTALAVCGASPRNSNRAMPLKIVTTLFATCLPFVYHKLLFSQGSITRQTGYWLAGASAVMLVGALFERKTQSRRVLASKYSKWTLLFNTGAANSFLLALILGTAAIILTKPDNTRVFSILACMLLLSGLCQLERGRDGKKTPVITPTATLALVSISGILYIGTNAAYRKYFTYFIPWMERSPLESSLIAVCGILLYMPLCISAIRQQFDNGQ